MADRTNRRNTNKNSNNSRRGTSSNDRVIYFDREEMLGRREQRRSLESESRNTPRRNTAPRRRGSEPVRMYREGANRQRPVQRHRNEVRPNRRPDRMPQQPVRRPRPESHYLPEKRKRKRRGPIFPFNIISRYIRLSYDTDALGEKRPGRVTSRQANNGGMLIVVVVFFLLILVYLGGYALNMVGSDEVTYETVQIGSVDSAKSADGIIVRAEKVFTSPAAGAVEYAVAEDEKIKSGTVVCSISDEQTVAQLQQELDRINENILKMQENREDLSEHTEEVAKINTQIQNLTDENTFDFVKGDISGLYTLKQNVEKQIDTRNQLLLTENSGALSDLVGQRTTELNQINDNITSIASDVGGIVSYDVDGLESTFTPEALATLTKEQVEQSSTAVSGTKTTVAAGEPVFKVITSNNWYIASYMPDTYTDGWEVGARMNIYVQNGGTSQTIPVTVNTLNHGDSEAYVVFETNEYMSDYMSVRNITFEVDRPKEGYKIPNTAISQQTLLKVPMEYVDADNGTLFKVTDSGLKETEVTISGYDETGKFALIPIQMGLISVGDTIGLKDSDTTYVISDVVTEDGVFIVNSGVTAFTKIDLTGSVTNGNYTVLDETANPNISIYDRIVQNVANVQENQNIYE